MTLTLPHASDAVLVGELEQLVAHGDLPTTMRRSAEIAAAFTDPALAPAHSTCERLVTMADSGGLAAIVAIESLGTIDHPDADAALRALLVDADPVLRRHAAWRLVGRMPERAAVGPLVDVLLEGGMSTLLAHRTLREWSASRPTDIARALVDRLGSTPEAARRVRLVDLLGAIEDPGVVPPLLGIAADDDEPSSSRISAIEAVGERPGPDVEPVLRRLIGHDGAIGTVAAMAVDATPITPTSRGAGLRIAQLVLSDGLDGQLSRGGRGDIGGVASLLVSLGDAFARRPDTAHVVTIGRGDATDASLGALPAEDGAGSYAAVRLGDDDRPADRPDAAWEQVPALERGLRRLLRRSGPFDVLHLRMSDAGTLAGADVARSLAVPICFSLAPDPHAVIDSLEARGELDRSSFPRFEQAQHAWFRARLVERLARDADRLAIFPRKDPGRYFAIPAPDRDRRHATVAEGIDLGALRRIERAAAPAPVLAELAEQLAPHRRGRPLILSVGRLHPVKGMERVVDAWASRADLHEATNLVIVGGDLEDPSEAERQVLADIDRALPPDDPRRTGVVLLGGRRRDDVMAIQAAVRSGTTAWAPGGIYVDGALKEEFGLAVLEALAAGLPVVAPATGGPATYVEDGVTGILVEPGASLAAAMHRALALAESPERAVRARTMVEERYSIDAMAAQLTELYRPAGALL